MLKTKVETVVIRLVKSCGREAANCCFGLGPADLDLFVGKYRIRPGSRRQWAPPGLRWLGNHRQVAREMQMRSLVTPPLLRLKSYVEGGKELES
jgi:hypothetical protein